MITRRIALMLSVTLLVLAGCEGGEGGQNEEQEGEPEETISIESGTHAGTITAVNPEETEIYVEFQDGSVYGLYFTDSTEVTGRSGSTVPFDSLARGQSIDVTVEQREQSLNPLSVTINKKVEDGQ